MELKVDVDIDKIALIDMIKAKYKQRDGYAILIGVSAETGNYYACVFKRRLTKEKNGEIGEAQTIEKQISTPDKKKFKEFMLNYIELKDGQV